MTGTPLKVIILVLSVSFLVADSLLCSQKWNMTAVGYWHTLGIMANGSLYVWGTQGHEQLGLDIPEGTNVLIPTPLMPHETFKFVATNNVHRSFAITTDGRLFTWGWSAYPPLSDNNQKVPVQVGNDSDWKMIAVGDEHVLALKNNGKLYAWGKGEDGEIGNGYIGLFPNPVPVVPAFTWKTVAAGSAFSLGIRADGALFAWGANFNGQLGDKTDIYRELPIRIVGKETFSMVSAAESHALAIDTDGYIYAWGRNDFGASGLPRTEKDLNVPTIPDSTVGYKWKAVSAGNYYSMALRADGTLWSFGANYYGQLGDGTKNESYIPVQVLSDRKWVSVSAGNEHSMGITADGQAIGWGYGYYGQLGDGTRNGDLAPTNCPQKEENKTETAQTSPSKVGIVRKLSSQIKQLLQAH